jgi:hypothetical protein
MERPQLAWRTRRLRTNSLCAYADQLCYQSCAYAGEVRLREDHRKVPHSDQF